MAGWQTRRLWRSRRRRRCRQENRGDRHRLWPSKTKGRHHRLWHRRVNDTRLKTMLSTCAKIFRLSSTTYRILAYLISLLFHSPHTFFVKHRPCVHIFGLADSDLRRHVILSRTVRCLHNRFLLLSTHLISYFSGHTSIHPRPPIPHINGRRG